MPVPQPDDPHAPSIEGLHPEPVLCHDGATLMRRAFYTFGDRRYFLGIAALVNSLRLLGHGETIHVLDFGLTDAQRATLEREVELVAAPPGSSPLLGHFGLPLERPADAMVMLDSDVIATRSLEPIFRLVEGGKLVVYTEGPSEPRRDRRRSIT